MQNRINHVILLSVAAGFAFTVFWKHFASTAKDVGQGTLSSISASNPVPEKIQSVAQNKLAKSTDAEVLDSDSLEQEKNPGAGEALRQYVCRKPETREIAKESSGKIYQWKDESGNTVFSDARPSSIDAGVSDLSENHAATDRYFNLQILDEKASLLLGAKERITSDVSQIYYLLSKELDVKALRQVNLNIRLFNRQDDFQAYRESVAPMSSTNSGFYIPDLNEVTVFQFPGNDELTYSVIKHEATHVILGSLYGWTPVWFNEGLSEYFEELSVSGQARTVNFVAGYHKDVAASLDATRLPGLASFFSLGPDGFYSASLDLHYGMAWSLVFFMLSDQQGRVIFSAIIENLANHPCTEIDMASLLNNHYDGGLTGFEARWHEWLANPYNTSHYY